LPDPIETAWCFGERQVGYYEMPEIIACAAGSITTVRLQTYDEHEDNSMRGLRACSVTEETLLTTNARNVRRDGDGARTYQRIFLTSCPSRCQLACSCCLKKFFILPYMLIRNNCLSRNLAIRQASRSILSYLLFRLRRRIWDNTGCAYRKPLMQSGC
jgi:hypothetical protein